MADRDLGTSRKQVFGTVERGTECRVCGRDVTDGRMVYCSDYCSELADAVMGLLNWGMVRRLVIQRDDRTCRECGLDIRWIEVGNEHIRAIVNSKLPDRPKRPNLDTDEEPDEDDRSDYFERDAQWSEQRDALYERYGDPWTRDHRLEVDHITPISEGGHPFDPANLQTLCGDCHEAKSAREAGERAERRRLERPDVEQVLFDYVANGDLTLEGGS